MRAMAKRDRQHLVGRCHFEIERQSDLSPQARNIVITDMPPVFAKMRGNPIGASLNRQ
jgi:hypothetical protein